jgi:hypothetical protein
MSDHVVLPNIYYVNSTQTYDSILRDPVLFNATLEQWNANKTGPFSGSILNHIGWNRLPENETEADPAPGKKSPHWELLPVVSLIIL